MTTTLVLILLSIFVFLHVHPTRPRAAPAPPCRLSSVARMLLLRPPPCAAARAAAWRRLRRAVASAARAQTPQTPALRQPLSRVSERLSLVRSRRPPAAPCAARRVRPASACRARDTGANAPVSTQAFTAAAPVAPPADAAPGEAEALVRRFELTQTETLCAVELPQRMVAVRACCALLLLAS